MSCERNKELVEPEIEQCVRVLLIIPKEDVSEGFSSVLAGGLVLILHSILLDCL